MICLLSFLLRPGQESVAPQDGPPSLTEWLCLIDSSFAFANSLSKAFCLCCAAHSSALEDFLWARALALNFATAARLANLGLTGPLPVLSEA